ncbi:MAG TPA: glycosyltransferase family 4 protein [Bacteroidia bacterium]|nr:glycosyltransferase family 4 protein [Bacteroidia bacterium]
MNQLIKKKIMRILEINTEKTWRGGERQTWYNIKGFRDASQQVELLCLEGFPLQEKTKELSIPIHTISSKLKTFFFLAGKGSSYDIIHVQTANAQFHAWLSKPFHRRKIVYTRRVDFVPKGFFTKLKYRRTDKLIAISTPIRIILEKNGVKNIDLITEIVEAKTLNVERAKSFIAENGFAGKKILATTSAIVQHKDPLTMAEAIYELSKKRTDFVFLHFGDGILKPELETKIGELGIGQFYKLPGFIDKVEDFFSVFDVFVMSSEEEGLGSSVLDAFMYKVPVVSTNAGGLKEIIGEAGLVSEVKNAKALAENMNRILSDPELKKNLTAKAYEITFSRNSISKVTEEYLAVFRKMLAGA